MPQNENPELSSPACWAHEADDAYMGYASRDELLAFLNELLEAERAGSRVTLRTAAEVSDAGTKALIEAVQRDEAHWCGVLMKAIQTLNGEASKRTGAFYEKAMAIPGLPERLAFLNRGQGWVVRKLREMLPRIRDDRIHHELAEMLAAHERNIALVEGRSV